MRFIIITIAVLSLCTACTSIKKIGENEYKISIRGKPFEGIEELKRKVNLEAEKICAPDKFEFVPNFFGENFAFKQDPYNTRSGDYTATATIKCRPKSLQ